jgi:Fe2+ transport system protein FeoA
MVTRTPELTVSQAADEATAGGLHRGARRGAVALDSLPFGTNARVVSVGGEGSLALRLMEMGVIPGAPVCVIKSAPLGDPLEVRVRGYHLALRRNEAHAILVSSDE